MAKQLQKLELNWIGKGNEPQLEPRILIEDTGKSYGDDKTENMLIHGDNLLALKALEQNFTGKVKCIYIDPPYNTGNAFEHYDDGVEHSLWLSLMKPRLELLKNLLKDDGSIWISIDDDESHYLKVMCDEIFGRKNFVANIVWQKRISPDFRAVIGDGHEHILVYAKKAELFSVNKLPKTEEQISKYKNPDNDPRGPWASTDFSAQGFRPNQMYPIVSPNGKIHYPPKGSCWKNVEEVYQKLLKEGRFWFGKDGNGVPRRKTYLSEQEGQVAWTWWTNKEVGHTQEAKGEIKQLFAEDVFATPKPERLLNRIIHLATKEDDIVLDSFLGSGTTPAVAHKMKRKWIGIELGEHATTHCFPRLKKVVLGEDEGGITSLVNWESGGGFKFYTLAPSLIKKDKYGSEIINPTYNPNMLAAAMAKQEGFRYSPDETSYWKQGFSSEKDFIFTTTQFITVQMLDKLAEELKPGESLLVCCKSFAKGCTNRHSNITIKKIPQMLLGRCEFGKDDYSLNIVNLPHDNAESSETDNIEISIEIKSSKSKKPVRSAGVKKADDDNQPSLF